MADRVLKWLRIVVIAAVLVILADRLQQAITTGQWRAFLELAGLCLLMYVAGRAEKYREDRNAVTPNSRQAQARVHDDP